MSDKIVNLSPSDLMLAFTIARRVPCRRVAVAIDAVRKTFAGAERLEPVSGDDVRDAVLAAAYDAITKARLGELRSGEVIRTAFRSGFTIDISRFIEPQTGEQFRAEFRFGVASVDSERIATQTDFTNVF